MDKQQFNLMFDSLEDPVLFVRGDKLVHQNAAYDIKAMQMKHFALPSWGEIATNQEKTLCTFGEQVFVITKSVLKDGVLLFFRAVIAAEHQKLEILGETNFASTFRNKLASYSSALDRLFRRLEEDKLKAKYEDILTTQAQAFFSLLRMVNQLELLVSDREEDYPFEYFNFSSMCEKLSYEVESILGEADIDVSYDIAKEVMPVYGNEVLLKRLIVSLLSNALKFKGENGSVSIMLSKSANRLWFIIRQEGKGIPDDRLSTLFSAETPESIPLPNEGSGLDLWLAQRIARAHGGSIWAGNLPEDKGTEFSLFLPLGQLKNMQLKNKAKGIATKEEDVFSLVFIGLADALPAKVFPLSFDYI